MLGKVIVALGLLSKDRSIPALIINTRRLREFSRTLLLLSVIMLALIYLLWIYPVFEEADFTNPAVASVFTSKRYQEVAFDAFERLKGYNDGYVDDTDFVRYDLHGIDSFNGVIVRFDLDLLPTGEQRRGGGSKYKYEHAYRLTINFAHFVVFLIMEAFLLFFGWCFLFVRPPAAQTNFEESVLQSYFSLEAEGSGSRQINAVDRVLSLLERFHVFVKDLNRRQRNRSGFLVEDEYDVQDLVFALLRLGFANVKSEDSSPNIAGGGSRVDFLLPNEELVIEVKMARSSMTDRTLGSELILDLARYRSHPNCKKIVFFVYDPEGYIKNPIAFQDDLPKISEDIQVFVVFAPPH